MEYFDSVGVGNHVSRAHTQWQNGIQSCRSCHQLDHENDEITSHSHGGLWARGEILVQGSLRREGCPQRHLQATARVNALHLVVYCFMFAILTLMQ